MNERIRKLAEQAFESAHGENGTMPMMLQKFAELIVRECIETLGTHENYWTHEQCMDELKKHFGVE